MIIAFTGAGISQPSGIPTFQEQDGLRNILTRSFANENSEKYNETIKKMKEIVDNAKPNDAHLALSEYKIPIITMNIDSLHTKAGSENVIEIHGTLPNYDELNEASLLYEKPILYGDLAPKYQIAINKMYELGNGDTLLVVGTSGYTGISQELVEIAYINGANIVRINDNSQTKVRKFLEEHFKEK